MSRARARVTRTPALVAPALLLAACSAAAAGDHTSAGNDASGDAVAAGAPPPVAAEPLTDRHEFTDDIAAQLRIKPDGRSTEVINLRDASRITVVEITVQPGARFPWHTHPGPALTSVVEGELIYVYADDCVERPYPQGTAFVDPGGDNVHTAINPTDDETVVVATILDAPAEGPVTVPVADEDQAAALDEACGLEPAGS